MPNHSPLMLRYLRAYLNTVLFEGDSLIPKPCPHAGRQTSVQTILLRNPDRKSCITPFVTVSGSGGESCEVILCNSGETSFRCVTYQKDLFEAKELFSGDTYEVPVGVPFALKTEGRSIRVAFFFSNHGQLVFDSE